MENYVRESIKNNSRKNIRYIYPVASNEELCQQISAFSNSSGGYIVLGVSDDGKMLRVKSSDFELREDALRKKLSSNVIMKFSKMLYNNSQLIVIHVEKSDTLVTYKGTAYALDKNMKIQKINIKKLFLSYCHSDKCIADIVDKKLHELASGKISITRDISAMEYKDDLEKFMQTIEQHDFAITIISDKYLKSSACMYEISELMRDRKYFEKLLFIILSASDIKYYDDNVKETDITADIYSTNRFNYIKYWESKRDEINEVDNTIKDISVKRGIVDEARKVNVISHNISDFIEKLKTSLGKSFDEMLENNFKDFLSIILEQ